VGADTAAGAVRPLFAQGAGYVLAAEEP